MSQIKILFFASYKELLGEQEIELAWQQSRTVNSLCEALAAKGGAWQKIFGQNNLSVKVAINQEIAEMDSKIEVGDEVAFFPPVTGG